MKSRILVFSFLAMCCSYICFSTADECNECLKKLNAEERDSSEWCDIYPECTTECKGSGVNLPDNGCSDSDADADDGIVAGCESCIKEMYKEKVDSPEFCEKLEECKPKCSKTALPEQLVYCHGAGDGHPANECTKCVAKLNAEERNSPKWCDQYKECESVYTRNECKKDDYLTDDALANFLEKCSDAANECTKCLAKLNAEERNSPKWCDQHKECESTNTLYECKVNLPDNAKCSGSDYAGSGLNLQASMVLIAAGVLISLIHLM